jgi:hypothetical protein
MGNRNYGRKEKKQEINKEKRKLESSMYDIFTTLSAAQNIYR